MRSPARILRATDTTPVWFGTERSTRLLAGDPDHAVPSVWHMVCRKGNGSPPHVHRRDDEAFYVLDGELTFLFGDTTVTAGPGSFVWAPRDIPHNFTGSSDTPATALVFVTPSRFDDFVAGFAEPVTDPEAWPAMRPDQIQTILRTAPDIGVEMLPPTFAMPTTNVAAPRPSARRWVMGEHVSYLATAAQTGGQFTAVEIRTTPAGGPPPHAHTDCDELMYVVAGPHQIFLDGQTDVAHPGDLVWIPKRTRHAYSNAGTDLGKTLSLHTPGGFERFFDEAGVDADVHEIAPRMAPPPPEAVAALLARHGMTA